MGFLSGISHAISKVGSAVGHAVSNVVSAGVSVNAGLLTGSVVTHAVNAATGTQGTAGALGGLLQAAATGGASIAGGALTTITGGAPGTALGSGGIGNVLTGALGSLAAGIDSAIPGLAPIVDSAAQLGQKAIASNFGTSGLPPGVTGILGPGQGGSAPVKSAQLPALAAFELGPLALGALAYFLLLRKKH